MTEQYIIKVAYNGHNELVVMDNSSNRPRVFNSEEEAESWRQSVWPESSRVERFHGNVDIKA